MPVFVLIIFTLPCVPEWLWLVGRGSLTHENSTLPLQCSLSSKFFHHLLSLNYSVYYLCGNGEWVEVLCLHVDGVRPQQNAPSKVTRVRVHSSTVSSNSKLK